MKKTGAEMQYAIIQLYEAAREGKFNMVVGLDCGDGLVHKAVSGKSLTLLGLCRTLELEILNGTKHEPL